MSLSNQQLGQLDQALRSAFPRKIDLQRLLKYALGENLLDIVADGNLQEITFYLIEWSESRGRTQELIKAAINENPRNPDLRDFVSQTEAAALRQSPAPIGADNRPQSQAQSLPAALLEPPASVGAPASGKLGVLIDLSHAQDSWESPLFQSESDHGLAILGAPPQSARWDLQAIDSSLQINADTLKAWSGIIFAIPYHVRIADTTIYELIRWVRQGGRLILLGFELGERHHETNLNELAGEFGIRFNSDIVAPQGWQPYRKPYNEPIDFTGLQLPDLFEGVNNLRLWNLCTLTVEPGADFLLALGDHAIGWMRKEGVTYTRNGMLRSANQQFAIFNHVDWVPVIAQAPEALTGKGSVLAIGTWQLFTRQGNFPAGFDNQRFIANLLDWCGKP